MRKIVRRFADHAVADRAEPAIYARMTPRARIELVEVLRRRYDKIRHARQQRLRRVLRITQRA